MSDWVERVRDADAGAEELWRYVRDLPHETSHEEAIAATLLVIAAELRAQRISQRPHEEPS